MSKKKLYCFIFIAFLWGVSYYLSGFLGVMQLIVSYSFYVLVSFGVYKLFKTVLSKTSLGIIDFSIWFTYKVGVVVGIVVLVFGGFVYYQNSIHPAKMPLYTLTNGEKTLKFQAMSHIAQERFYEGVQRSIIRAKEQNYVLFYEGVRWGSKKSEQIFRQALWVQITPEIYKNFAALYGVVHQEQEDFLGIRNDLDYNVDLDIDTIVQLYLEKVPKEVRNSYLDSPWEDPLPDITQDLFSRLEQLNERQLGLLRYINQSLLNFMIKHDGLRNQIVSQLNMQDIFSVILDERDQYIAQEILVSPQEKIFVMYGLMHFEWVFALLQRSDSNWEIIDTSYSYPISSPQEFLRVFWW